jgi:hypothetical protein
MLQKIFQIFATWLKPIRKRWTNFKESKREFVNFHYFNEGQCFTFGSNKISYQRICLSVTENIFGV